MREPVSGRHGISLKKAMRMYTPLKAAVYALKGGWYAWKKAGYPVEKK
jgi:rhodanese-related sulfurtransferase